MLASLVRLGYYQKLKHDLKDKADKLYTRSLFLLDNQNDPTISQLKTETKDLLESIVLLHNGEETTYSLEAKTHALLEKIASFNDQIALSAINAQASHILKDIIWLNNEKQRPSKIKKEITNFFNPDKKRKSKLKRKAKHILGNKKQRQISPAKIEDDIEANVHEEPKNETHEAPSSVFSFLNSALETITTQLEQATDVVHPAAPPTTPEKSQNSQNSTAEPSPESVRSSDDGDLMERGQAQRQENIEDASDDENSGFYFELNLSSDNSEHQSSVDSPVSLPDDSSEEDGVSHASEASSDSDSDSDSDAKSDSDSESNRFAHPNASRVNSSNSSLSSYISNDEYIRRHGSIEVTSPKEYLDAAKEMHERIQTHLQKLSILNPGKVAPEDNDESNKNGNSSNNLES